MNAYRLRRFCLTAIILALLLVAVSGGLRLVQADGTAAMRDHSAIQQEYPYKTFLPCILNRACFPIFFDDFSNPTSGWPVGYYPPITREYLNGEYHIQIAPVQYGAVATASPDVQATDFRAAVSVHISAYDPLQNNPFYGLVFSLNADKTQFYSFEIEPDGKWGIWSYQYIDGSGADRWINIKNGPSNALNQGTGTNRLAVERSGNTITIYINNQFIDAVTDTTYSGPGYIGVIGENNTEYSISFYFDDFSVDPLNCN